MGGTRALTAELLFAYGTLRRGGAAAELLGGARSRGRARYRGRLYDLGRYPGAVPSADPADRVQGELFELVDAADAADAAGEADGVPSRLLARLDRYEGPEFQRVRARVTLPSGAARECWIYLYTGALDGLPRIPSGDYLAP